jgi:hypothetical protein
MSMPEAAAMESFLQGATNTTKRGGRRTNIAWMTLDGREGGREGGMGVICVGRWQTIAVSLGRVQQS